MAKSKKKTQYVCQSCGAQRSKYEGKCSDCGTWNSFVEEIMSEPSPAHGWSLGQTGQTSNILTLDQDIQEQKLHRISTGFSEFDRVLGGGLVKGSFVLLGGAPGIGKSTLLLQMAGGLSQSQAKILYVSGEESVNQTGSRAQRLGIRSKNISLVSESNLNQILELTSQLNPDIVVVDSIQTVFTPELDAAPGSVSQVRECAGHLMSLAKNKNISVMLIGHVTKDGHLAGPKVLEHMVDCVLSFDGDLSHHFRLLRALKNRFGATHELGVFQMNTEGLQEVENPSELFLQDRGADLIGSSIFSSMEGSRPLLCEVQALTLSSPTALPRRTSLGIDVNRLHMITAILDRHLNIQLSHTDIFINVVGGLKLNEPSSDLAVASALLSTEMRIEIPSQTVFFGELGLTGEVRAVTFPDLRIKEAIKLGFNTFVVPYSNKNHLNSIRLSEGKKIIWIKTVHELRNFLKSK